MTTTLAATITNIRRILNDNPAQDVLAAAISTAGATTLTPTDASLYHKGDTIEIEAELLLVTDVNTSTPVITIRRGHKGSTAATHAISSLVNIAPRFEYPTVSQAIDTVLDADLYHNGVYEIVEHQVTHDATTTAYNAPSSSCEEFLDIYQIPQTGQPPVHLKNFTRLGQNVDTTIYSNGKYFEIRENAAAPGSLYYVNCKHRLAIGTINTQQERITHLLSAAYLLEWTEPRRTAGPSNQGDRTVRPGQGVATAAYYRQIADKLLADEHSRLQAQIPPYRIFRRA